MTCKDCIHSGLCYKENDYDNFPDRCGDFISDKVLEERPQGEIIKCKDCKHRVKEWREDKRMKDKGYWVYGCKHFGEIMGYWGWGGCDDEFCSDAEKADMRGDNK